MIKTERVSYSLNLEVAKALNEYAEKTRLKKTNIVELAIMEYIKNHPVER